MLGDVPVWRHRGCSRHTPTPFAVRVASAVALTSSPPDMPKGPCGVIWVAVGFARKPVIPIGRSKDCDRAGIF